MLPRYVTLPGARSRGFFVLRHFEFEDSDLRSTPVLNALAVREAAIHIKVPAMHRIIPVRVVAIAVRVKAFAEAACRDLPAVRVAGEHPLPWVFHQLDGVHRI